MGDTYLRDSEDHDVPPLLVDPDGPDDAAVHVLADVGARVVLALLHQVITKRRLNTIASRDRDE